MNPWYDWQYAPDQGDWLSYLRQHFLQPAPGSVYGDGSPMDYSSGAYLDWLNSPGTEAFPDVLQRLLYEEATPEQEHPLLALLRGDPELADAWGRTREDLMRRDPWTWYADPFVLATMGLGLATGGAALAGGLGAEAAGGAGVAATGTAASDIAPVTLGTAGLAAPEVAGGAGVAAAGGAGGAISGVAPVSYLAPQAAAAGTAGTSGVLGTGLTAAQLAKLGLTGVSLAGTVANAAGVGHSDTGNGLTPDSKEATDALLQRVRQTGVATMPERQALADETLLQQTQLANGSPQAMMATLLPQVQQIRQRLQQAFQMASKQLGPGGGGQVERGERRAALQGGSLLQNLYAGIPPTGMAGQLKALTGFRPTQLAQLPQPVTTTATIPNQFGNIKDSVKSVDELSKLFGGTQGTNTNEDGWYVKW